ncbi:putative glucose-methanol-choline oxidoreductase, FAD/NAD(P)-binding domain superfamily [Septoria linicola]|nr:putative glucose-methanol-choline oxidoreductase, FAD/NAD(P)-binding domain superfamily [Septoria linicola]
MWLTPLAPLLLLATTVAAAPGRHGHDQLHHNYRRANETTEYEYVVIGSGPGGGPLAARLALAGHKVLLIEAGGDNNGVNQTVPARNLQSTEDPAISWDYFVTHYKDEERQARDSKMTYKRTDGSYYTGKYPPEGAEPLGILYPRAGALGGCAEHNAAVTIYPFESDWTLHQTLTGDDSWAPANMRTYFEKLEKAQYLTLGSGHGYDGWFSTSLTELALVATDFRVLSIVLAAASALGKGLITSLLSTITGLANVLISDMNGEYEGRDQKTDLFQIPQAVSRDTGKRSTPRNFILEVANARNETDGSRLYHLDVKLNTLATKIRFDQSGPTPKAIGVEYLSGEYLYGASPLSGSGANGGVAGYVPASKEVIISAGTFNTPQLLKLSGVGPREELEKFGIPVVKDLPGVGTNMQDRYEISIVGQTEDGEKLSISKDCTFGYDDKPDPCLEKWQTGDSPLGKGPYMTGGVAVGVTMKSTAASESEDPDLIVIGAPGLFAGYYPGFAFDSTYPGNIWSWLALKAHTHNHAGTVTLRSSNPRDVPQIDFNSLDEGTPDGHEKDLQALYEGLSFAREAFDKVIPLDGNFVEIKPGRNVTGEDGLKEYARDETWGHHACCSASIGAESDPNAVLDSKFRVRGVEGLRVVDASSFNKIPGTFIALPIYIISEKAADVIINNR